MFLKKNNRIEVIYSGLFSKIIGLISVFFLTYVLLPSDYGNLTYVLAIINIIIPFLGFGLNHSLLRYGDNSSPEELKKLTAFTLYRGSIITLTETILLIVFVYFFNSDMEISKISVILSFQLIFSYPLKIIQSRLQLAKKNKEFALTIFANSFVLFILLILGYYTFSFRGVLIAYMAYPLVTLIIFLFKNIEIMKWTRVQEIISKKELYRYGLFVGLASVASQMLYSMDMIMIKSMLNSSEMVAIYRVGSLISVNGLIFCNNIMNADFVYIKELDGSKVKDYYKKLSKKLFLSSLIMSLLSVPVVFFATNYLLNVVYKQSLIVHILLMIGFMISFSVRIPIGTILSARGYVKYNVMNAYASLGINLILNLFLIKRMGYMGAALATVITMLFGAIIALYLFRKSLKVKVD